jgi:hypothetical protein
MHTGAFDRLSAAMSGMIETRWSENRNSCESPSTPLKPVSSSASGPSGVSILIGRFA